MSSLLHLTRLAANRSGATVIEFAILAPAVIAMLMGVLAIGIQMQSYNALRSIAGDVNRYTVVEYQKSNELTEVQIHDVASSIAIRPPYRLSRNQIDVDVVEEASPVAGAKKFNLTIAYTPFNALKSFKLGALTVRYQQNIFVPA